MPRLKAAGVGVAMLMWLTDEREWLFVCSASYTRIHPPECVKQDGQVSMADDELLRQDVGLYTTPFIVYCLFLLI